MSVLIPIGDHFVLTADPYNWILRDTRRKTKCDIVGFFANPAQAAERALDLSLKEGSASSLSSLRKAVQALSAEFEASLNAFREASCGTRRNG